MSQRLKGRVCVVTGSSRGAGRGIACALGDDGATVYVTGRSVRGEAADDALTIDRTAEMVNERGGAGVAVQVDHTSDGDVARLFEQVKDECGRIDVLVNNVWGGYEGYEENFDAPFWEQPMWRWDRMFTAGLRAHFTASQHAARLMIAQKSGLIINTTAYDRGKWLGVTVYDTTKTAVNRLAYGMAIELREHGITAMALAPGFMRTETVLNAFNATEDDWHTNPEMQQTESVFYVGRGVAALASDANVSRHSGRTLSVGDVAAEYGFTDVDGRQIPAFRIPDDYLKD